MGISFPPNGSADVKWNGVSASCHGYYFTLNLIEKLQSNSCLGQQGKKSDSWEVCSVNKLVPFSVPSSTREGNSYDLSGRDFSTTFSSFVQTYTNI